MAYRENRVNSSEAELASAIKSLLESIPGMQVINVTRNPAPFERAFDICAHAKLPRTGNEVELWIECRDLPRPSRFPYVSISRDFREDGSTRARVPVLAAPHISERMAELCWEHGWGWFDLAGNCRLSVPGMLYVERTGRPAVHQPPKPKANLHTAAAARVLRTLLVPENAGRVWTQTALQQASVPNVSLGLVNKLVRYLRDEDWLVEAKDGGVRVRDPFGLMEVWQKAYRFDRHHRIGYFSLLSPEELDNSLEGWDLIEERGPVAYAVFSAADRQAPSVRQTSTWLYVSEDYLSEFGEIAQAKPVQTGANIQVLLPEDDGIFYKMAQPFLNRFDCTNPLQTWLDLMKVGSRGEEAADAIMRERLRPVWEEALRDAT